MEELNQEYRIVRASEVNIADLSRLFKESRGIHVPVDYLKRKYNTAFTSKTYFAHFAYSADGTPAAFFCLFPCFVRINGEKKLAGQSADIITHVDHQRKGLFGLLGRATEALAKQEGMNYLFAFPNSNSFPGFYRSLNWHHPGNFKIYSFPISGIPIYRILHKLKLGKIYSLWKSFVISMFRSKEETFIGADFESGENVCWRDESFFSYKKYNDNFVCELNGFRIWAKVEGTLIVGDISRSNMPIEKLINKISRLCKLLGLDSFQIEVSEGSFYDKLLRDKHAFLEGVPIVFKNLDMPEQKLSLSHTGADADVF